MTDILATDLNQSTSTGVPLVRRFRDMGDGTFSEVQTSSADINSGAAGGTPFTAVVGPITGTTSTAIKAAGGTGVKNKLSSYNIVNTAAVASSFNILDGTTVIWTDSVAANSKAQYTFPTPLVGTANKALNIQFATTATSSTVSVTGYQGA